MDEKNGGIWTKRMGDRMGDMDEKNRGNMDFYLLTKFFEDKGIYISFPDKSVT